MRVSSLANAAHLVLRTRAAPGLDAPSTLRIDLLWKHLLPRTRPGADHPGYVEDYPFAAGDGGGVGPVTLGLKYGVLSEAGRAAQFIVRNDFVIPTVTNRIHC